jgi:aspartate-semialdehyde dehydrogenase
MNLALRGQRMMKITNHNSINALMEAIEPILQCLGIKQIMIRKVISISGNTKYQNLKTKP